MDTTPEYIKMCERAVEIQPCLNDPEGVGGTWLRGNIICHVPVLSGNKPEGLYHVMDTISERECDSCGGIKSYIESSRAIWLPRQDQLQEMIEGHWTEVFGKFTYWLDGPNSLVSIPSKKLLRERVDFVKRLETLDSMEQLWLAYVMYKLHNKVWNGTDWVVE